MPVIVRIPVPLQRLTQGKMEVEAAPGTIASIIDDLEKKYPGVKERLTKNGKVAKFVLFFVNEEDIRFLNNDETEVKDGDEVSIVPAIAGG